MAGGRLGSDNGERQRQAAAPGDDLFHGGGRRPHPRLAEPVSQHLERLGTGERVHPERMSARRGHQARQLAATRHQHRAPRRAGQQWADLRGLARVVQDEQDPLPSQQAPVEGRLIIHNDRYPVRRYAERVQEPSQRLGRAHRIRGRAEAAQVDVELPVREPVSHAMGPTHGEAGLTNPGGSGYDSDPERARMRPGRSHGLVQAGQLGASPDEAGQVRRQLRRQDGRIGSGGGPHLGPLPRGALVGRAHRVPGPQQGVGPQHRLVQPPQVDAGLDAELLPKLAGECRVRRQGLGLPAVPVERHHERGGGPLAVGMVPHEPGQLGNDAVVVTEPELERQALLPRRQPVLVQPRRLAAEHPARQSRQCRTAPQGQGRPKLGDRRPGIAGNRAASGSDHAVERVRVELAVGHVQRVSGTGRRDQTCRSPAADQAPAELGDQVPHLVAGGRRGLVLPDRVDQPIDTDRATRVEQERGRDRLLTPAGQPEPVPVREDLQGAQDPELRASHPTTAPNQRPLPPPGPAVSGAERHRPRGITARAVRAAKRPASRGS
ncbi:MAG TPA: hypothetical protein VFM37_16755 [Pseudonocardiaceae bacterium]|nr:hypothetical protein [Pseudonocardiaceae bacterium]